MNYTVFYGPHYEGDDYDKDGHGSFVRLTKATMLQVIDGSIKARLDRMGLKITDVRVINTQSIIEIEVNPC